MRHLVQITTTFACAGVLVEGDAKQIKNCKIVKASSIFKWSRGKLLGDLITHYVSKETLTKVDYLGQE